MYEVEVLTHFMACEENAFFHFDDFNGAMDFVKLSIKNGYEVIVRFIKED